MAIKSILYAESAQPRNRATLFRVGEGLGPRLALAAEISREGRRDRAASARPVAADRKYVK